MKFLCIFWDICAVYACLKVIVNARGDGPAVLGALIGFALLALLPTYYCFKEKDEVSKRPKTKSSSSGVSKTNENHRSYTPNNDLIPREYRNETYYQRLKRLCNPSNFMDEYDKEKVDIANEIYSKAMSLTSDDKAAVFSLIETAESNLHINFLDEMDYNNMVNKLNPKKYVETYDADRVSLANDLYAQIMQPDVNLTMFLRIKEQAKPLTDYLESIQKKSQEEYRKRQVAERRKQEEAERNLAIVIGVVGVALAIVVAVVIFLTK